MSGGYKKDVFDKAQFENDFVKSNVISIPKHKNSKFYSHDKTNYYNHKMLFGKF